MSRFLLDSHVFIWWVNADPRLNMRTIESVRRTSDVYVSAATIWELSLKNAKGKLEEKRSLIALAEESGFKLLAVQPEHAEAAATLPYHHRNPFDHMMLAQAKVEGLTLVTHDRILSSYGIAVLLV